MVRRERENKVKAFPNLRFSVSNISNFTHFNFGLTILPYILKLCISNIVESFTASQTDLEISVSRRQELRMQKFCSQTGDRVRFPQQKLLQALAAEVTI